MANQYTVFVVPHTHWDRAWYVPFEEFRLRLIRLIDRVCDTLENDPEFTTFCLDGQSIVLEDYLQVRPQMEERLRTLIKAKRLFVGPWYVLPDEFLVSGESLIRNLMLGQQIARRFGRPMRVGYVPDPFGHIAQLPQILQGFDLDTFVFARGVDGEDTDLKLEFHWTGPDGSRVLALHQRQFYNNAAFLGYRIVWGDPEMLVPDRGLAMERIKNAFEGLRKDSVTHALLLNNGVDHSEHQPEMPELIAAARKEFPEYQFRIASFEDYANAIKKELNGVRLQQKSGELTYAYGDMLTGVYSTRIYLKQSNRYAQDLLEKQSEPLTALAFFAADQGYPQDQLWYAWRMLLKNHPHDDICGCSVDQVHRDMEHRFAQVDIVGGVLARDAIRAIARNLDNSRQAGVPNMVFNPHGSAARGVMEIAIDLARPHEPWTAFQLFDENGEEIPYELVESSPHFWMETGKGFDVMRHRVRLHLDVPACGYRTLYAREGRPARPETIAAVENRSFENGHFKLAIGDDGTLTYQDKATGARFRNLLQFEDREDCGDEYNWSYLRKSEAAITTAKKRARIKLLQRDALGATWRITHDVKVPESLSTDRKSRSKRAVTLTVETLMTCRADSPRIDFVTHVDNNARDHRLRVLFPAPLQTDTVTVDEHFGLVERSIELPPARKLPPYPTQHQGRFTSLFKEGKGAAFINDGLPEFEVVAKGKQRIYALTLFRAVGTLSRDDYPTRPMAAGPPSPAPEGQCLRPLAFRYAFMGHGGDLDAVASQALLHNVAPTVMRCDIHGGSDMKQMGIHHEEFLRNQPMQAVPREGELPDHGSFIDLGNERLRLSAIKKCEKRDTLIVRFYNPANDSVSTTISVFRPVKRAWETNLDENREHVLRVNGGAVSITCPGYRIMTLELELA